MQTLGEKFSSGRGIWPLGHVELRRSLKACCTVRQEEVVVTDAGCSPAQLHAQQLHLQLHLPSRSVVQ